MEYRSFEFRAVSANEVEGVLIRYGERTRIGSFEERFVAGSIGSVSTLDLIANLQHNRQAPLARSGSGLTLTDTQTELRAKVSLPNTSHGNDARELIANGVLRGFSLEFRAVEEDWQGNLRTIKRAQVTGFGIVDRPAYAGSTIEEIRQNGFVAPEAKRWLYL